MFATLLTAIILLTSAPATAASPRSPVTALKIPSVHTAFPSNLHERLARQTILGDGYGGEGYMVEPILTEEEPATVILIHGMGGTGEEWGFVSLALSFFSLNYVKFIIPTAPTRFVSYLNETIPSWYDISKIANFATTVSRPELFESVDRVDNIIRGEIAAGVKQNRIFVIGFSQGGGLALTTFLRSSFNLAGCIGVATWLPLDSDYPDNLSPTVSNKQILLMHVSFPHFFCFSHSLLQSTYRSSRILFFHFPFTQQLTYFVIEIPMEHTLFINNVLHFSFNYSGLLYTREPRILLFPFR